MSTDDREYYWVVICKNHGFHQKQNLFYGHKIVLARTDEYASPPRLAASFKARCDDCGKEYSYRADDLMRAELEPREPFEKHPLFPEVA